MPEDMMFSPFVFLPSDYRGTPEAGARLIAAAPDMLRALKEAEIVLLALCKSGSSKKALAAYDRVGAAIAKAEGKR